MIRRFPAISGVPRCQSAECSSTKEPGGTVSDSVSLSTSGQSSGRKWLPGTISAHRSPTG